MAGTAEADAEVLLIAQISDVHVVEPGRLFAGIVDTAACFASAVERLNRLDPAPDMVLVTGDLVESGLASQYEHFRSILAGLRAPVRLLPGNHDDRAMVRELFFPDRSADARVYEVVELGDLVLVMLDDVLPGSPCGKLGDEQLVWLDGQLADLADRPTIVALHHPPFVTGIKHMDGMGLVDRDAFAAVIRRHPQVECVLSGHLHRPITTRWAGTVAITAPSVAHQVSLDLGPPGPATFTLEPPAMLLHRWTPDGGVVSHLSYIGEFAGPYRFPH